MATYSESHRIDAPRSKLFMESSPAPFLTELPVDAHQLFRKVTIAAGTAAVVYLVAELAFGVAAAW